MKYISADKLIAEIKFAKSVYDNPKRVIFGVADGFRQDGRAAMYDDILKMIASLQQEQPDIIEHICLCAGIPAPFMDGNQWSILKGDNIQVGVVGFGDTKEEALINFIKDIPLQQEKPEGGCSEKPNDLLSEWSKEDEEMLNSIIATCKLAAQERDSGPAKHLIEMQERFLKSLRSRLKSSDNWKPSEEQPEVDLEKEIKNYLATKCAGDDEPSVSEIARHFYELGIYARKED